MGRARDYVPSNAAQFNSFMQNLIDYVSGKIGWSPVTDTPKVCQPHC